jgi:hypothetical protein
MSQQCVWSDYVALASAAAAVSIVALAARALQFTRGSGAVCTVYSTLLQSVADAILAIRLSASSSMLAAAMRHYYSSSRADLS